MAPICAIELEETLKEPDLFMSREIWINSLAVVIYENIDSAG